MWILLSLAAMLANAVKVLTVKRCCAGVDSRLLVLSGRLLGALVLMPVLWRAGLLPRHPVFWTVIAATAVLTAVASLLLTEAIKNGPLALVIPLQAAVPVFSLLALIVGFGQHPRPLTIALMLLSMALVALMLYGQKRGQPAGTVRWRFVCYSAGAALIFGICTILDPVAIRQVASGALAYSGCWNLVSAILMAATGLTGRPLPWRQFRSDGPAIALYSLATLAAFFLQQYAVQLSLAIPGGVIHVKTLVMLHMPLAVLAGLWMLGEKTPRLALLAGLGALLSGIALIRTLLP